MDVLRAGCSQWKAVYMYLPQAKNKVLLFSQLHHLKDNLEGN